MSREPKPKPSASETPKQKKARIAGARKAARVKPFESKESYRWVEAIKAVEKQFQKVEKHLGETKELFEETSDSLIGEQTRLIHIFDREGDIAEVFDQIRALRAHWGSRASIP